MRNALLVLSTLVLAACGTMSVDEVRETQPAKTYISERSPSDFSECVVGAFYSNARGFDMIPFNGAKSFRQGNRTTITADTGSPLYFLDVTPISDSKGGSRILERHMLKTWGPINYLKRFQDLTISCL